MSKSICLYFQIHQPTRLRLYRFFDIGKDSHYFDDFANRTILKRIAQRCYLPMNTLLLELIKKHKKGLKIAFSISGSALEQFDRYAPEVIASFRELAKTGNVEFLCETYNHSLASLASAVEFKYQVEKHKKAIEHFFGQSPQVFRNTELIYNDNIGEQVYDLGFKAMLTEGAKHIMAWRSPNFVYSNLYNSKLKLLLRNYNLSDDIAFRFSNSTWENWPLTAEKYLSWLKNSIEDGGDVINLFMDYETFGEHQKADTGILDFMKYFIENTITDKFFTFNTPSEVLKKYKAVSTIEIPETISWADEERDVTAWLGNELQQEAFKKLYGLYEQLALIDDPILWNDFGHLQESDHFYYMCTKFFSDGEVHKYFNPYESPYDAFINYMNVLSDFILRLEDRRSVLNSAPTHRLENISTEGRTPFAKFFESSVNDELKMTKDVSKSSSKAKSQKAKKSVKSKELDIDKADKEPKTVKKNKTSKATKSSKKVVSKK